MSKIHYTRFPATSQYIAGGSWQQVVVMEFVNRHDTTDRTDFCPCQLVTDLLQRNGCNEFWPK